MASSPAFAVTPILSSVSIDTQETSLTAPTNYEELIVGSSNGRRISEIVVKCAATSAAAIVRIFLHDGTNYFLFDEIAIAAATSSNTVTTTRVSTLYNNLILPSSSWSIRVTTSIAQATHVTALAADL
jgi:hypothetical protein